jgi:hypothetical protein
LLNSYEIMFYCYWQTVGVKRASYQIPQAFYIAEVHKWRRW